MKCWFMNDEGWEIGEVLSWSNEIVYLRNEVLLFPSAIIRYADGSIHGRYAKDIRLEEPEDLKPNAALTKAARRYNNRPANKSHRFRPRLEWADDCSRVLVQVHPETIEVFNSSGDYICQVRWIGGNMDYTQGGLPLGPLREMFKEANA